jgi:rhodanese-related sulfurtransferase
MPATTESQQTARRALLLLPFLGGFWAIFGGPTPRRPQLDIKEVLVGEAKVLIAAGALILDVRERVAYEARHIAGALSAPLDGLNVAIPKSLEHARNLPIVVYCGEGTRLGPEATHVLNKAGYAQAVNLKPGLQGWVSAGLALEYGKGQSA